ncbi:MAG TPA: leucyl/phenylalanyl-tRNA--protein transferase [Candidatus Hydrogenedens sp.]|nr:leucyl/phenylalanyl-tRNA--protein transferase [Candidatus Hydrogenedens sp.]
MQKPVWLKPEDSFPPEKYWQGWITAYGGDLSPSRLLEAYRLGIFPWYEEGEPIRWCSPDPRAVLPTHILHIPRRLWRVWKQKPFQITADTAFREVIHACAITPRNGEDGTWITSDIEKNYIRLHELGHAHSIECWDDNQLVGGLYGIHLGPIFVGESMFHWETNASKIAFLGLCGFAMLHNIKIIDCQIFSEYLEQFGTIPIRRQIYLNWLKENLPEGLPQEHWKLDVDEIYKLFKIS